MPVYTYEIDNHSYSVYAQNLYAAEEEIYSEWGQYPDSIKEAP